MCRIRVGAGVAMVGSVGWFGKGFGCHGKMAKMCLLIYRKLKILHDQHALLLKLCAIDTPSPSDHLPMTGLHEATFVFRYIVYRYLFRAAKQIHVLTTAPTTRVPHVHSYPPCSLMSPKKVVWCRGGSLYVKV